MNTAETHTGPEWLDKAKKLYKKCVNSIWFKIIKYLYHFIAVPCLINLCINDFFLGTTTITDTQFVSGYLFSYILMILFNALLTAITTSSVATNATLSVVALVFSAAQYVKIQMSDNPVYFSDINFFRSAGTLNDLVAEVSIFDMLGKISDVLVEYGIYFALIIIGGILLRFRLKYKWGGIAVGASVLAILILLIAPIQSLNTFTLNTFYKYDERDSDYPTTSLKYYIRYGVISGMYGQAVESRIFAPEGYDKEYLDKVLADAVEEAKDEYDGIWGDCNIIMVFSESFWDIDQLGEFEFSTPTGTELTENYERLAKEGHVFKMISPVFGGLSANAEFEVFTGSNLAVYSPGFVPYTQIYDNEDYEGTPNFFDILHTGSYYNKIITAWEDSLFDRTKVYPFYGIDDTDFRHELKGVRKLAGRPSDDYLADQVIKFIEGDEWAEKDNYFVMINTAQLHGSYYNGKYIDKDSNGNVIRNNYTVDVTKTPEGYSAYMKGSIRCYAQGLYDADRQLGKLYDYIQKQDEKTIIIFYGDHLPNLKSITMLEGAEDYERISTLPYFNTDSDLLNVYRKYDTECLIVGNFDMGEQDVEWLNYDLLMAYVMHRMDVETDPYYDFLYTQRKDFPAANDYIAADADGNIYSMFELPEELQKQYLLRKQINYRYFHDNN
ncbi:MAG: sulfatase-like hydrolase/transferase [Clostridia bacterium]|nr:sulfatase-like hydrolase/transferase [Clostridia bacterium]